MRRRLFTVVSALSLLLCVATLALWARSYFVGDRVAYDFAGEKPGFMLVAGHSSGGTLLFGYAVDPSTDRLSQPLWMTRDPWPLRLGTPVWWSSARAGQYWWRSVSFPHWLAAFLFAALPALWLIKWRRRRRIGRDGLCPACGYDLRATPDLCPECGLQPSRRTPADAPEQAK